MITDEELVKKVASGDEMAFEEITKRYNQRLNSITRKYFLVGAGPDDLMQEAMIGLYSACLSYKEDSGIPFKNFASLCVTRRLLQAVKLAGRDKNKAMMGYFSIDIQGKIVVGKTDEEDNEEVGFYVCAESLNPEESMLSHEKIAEINTSINEKLSDFERRVLKLYIEGYNYIEISKKLAKDPKSIDNALNRIKIKLKYLKK